MGAAIRRAHAVWSGDLRSGIGAIDASSSGAYKGLPVSWAARIEKPDSKTSPEELLASAHASCFCMALSHALAGLGKPPHKLEVTATVTFEPVTGGFRVTASDLELKAWVPGLDQAGFERVAEGVKEGCPISQALKGNVAISLKAALHG